MGKKKFEKNKGVTFKLIYKSSDDQDSSADKTLSERIFSVIEQQKKTAEKEDDQERKKILSQFTKQELGEAPIKKKKDPNQPAPDAAISSHAKGRNDLWITHLMRMKEQAKAQAEAEIEEEEEEEERKQKDSSKQKALLDKLRNKALKKHNEKELKKAKGTGTEEKDDEGEDGEGWESCEDDGDEEEGDDEEEEYEEWEEEEEEEYEEYEVDEEELAKLQIQGQGILKKESTLKKAGEEEPEERLVKAKPIVDGDQKGLVFEEIQVSKAPQVHFEDFPTLGTGEVMEFEHVDIPMPPQPEPKTEEQKVEEKAEEEIDLKRTIVQGDVKMQRFDDMGLPIDGYNYYQHVVDANSGGAPQFAFTVTYDHVVNLPEDNDFRLEKMNAEERELYEALEHDNADGAYDEIDDDFFGAIAEQSNVKLEEGYFDPRQKQKKVTFAAEGEIGEITTTKEEPGKKEAKKEEKGGKKDSVLARQDFNKVLDEHVSALKNRFKAERERNKARYGIESSDEEDVEEVEEFSDDEEEEEDGVREHIDQIPWEKDVAMQEAMKRDMEDSEEEDSDEEEEIDERRSMRSKGQATVADTEIFSLARKAKLNIIKEKRPDRPAEAEKESKKGEEEEDSEDEEDDQKGKVEEVFKKREKGETKEEKKARKEAIKQFKQERKEKKKKFKDTFDDKKKQHLKINQRQATSLQGTTVYKLTV